VNIIIIVTIFPFFRQFLFVSPTNTFFMKQILSTFLVSFLTIALTFNAQAQSGKTKTKTAFQRKENLKPFLKPMAKTGLEAVVAAEAVIPSASVTFRDLLNNETVGKTTYDLQSNGTESARVHQWPDGNVSAAFTVSNKDDGSGFPERGCGVNYRNKWLAGTIIDSSTEASLRTGFTNYVVTESGVEFMVAHRANGTGKYLLHTLRHAPGQTGWTESDIPTNTPNGLLWSKAAVDGENIYVIALTTPTALSGVAYQGVNGHVLFWRSTNGGISWDISDGIIPGIDSSNFAEIGSETYALDAQNGTLAVGIFDSWNDAIIVKSTDQGTTWGDPIQVLDFPLTKYKTDKGYTLDEIGGFNPDAPDSLAIFTSDGAASILIDNIGFVHAWFGRMYVADLILTDANSSYYPGVSGLLHWYEGAPADFDLAGDIIDANGNDTIDVASITGIAYGCGLSSMPTSAIDPNGNIYMAYSALSDSLVDADGLSFRHVLLTKSYDDGKTWIDPIDLHYAATTDTFIADVQEGVFPFMAKRVKGDVLSMVYELDYAPGSAVLVTGNQLGSAEIIYIHNPEIVALIGTKAPNFELNCAISPNPATDFANINLNLEKAAEVQVQLFDALGRLVSTKSLSNQVGAINVNLPIGHLNQGMYFVKIQAGKAMATRKLIVEGKR
jgi:hypothetical protein